MLPIPPEPAILACHTCHHLAVRVSVVLSPYEIRRHPECALRMPWGGRALRCDRYQREPGSDDELVRMDPHPLPVQTREEETPRRVWRPRGRWAIVGVAT